MPMTPALHMVDIPAGAGLKDMTAGQAARWIPAFAGFFARAG
jgi:hypothetical protein